jgi:hypothetical protein
MFLYPDVPSRNHAERETTSPPPPLHYDNHEMEYSELDAFLAISCSSTKLILIDLFISTRVEEIPWSDHDLKPYLMEYPDIRRKVEQDVLVIYMMRQPCYCTIR